MTNQKLDMGRVLPIFVLVFVDILGLTVILPLLHIYATTYGASPIQIGFVLAAFPLSQLIGVPMMGALSDRFGRKPLLLISQITTFLSFILLGVANSLLLIVLSRVIDGLFGANIATAQAAISDVTTEETRAQGLGLIGAAFGLGFILGPVTSIVALEISDQLSVPAFTAAAYSFISILLTLFVFKETLPVEKRQQGTRQTITPLLILQMLRRPQVNWLLVLMFAQQFIFFGFESLLGLFTLSRLGLLGQGNAIIFIVVGVVLVVAQVRLLGRFTQKYGEQKMVLLAFGLLAIGLILLSITPEQPHLFYVRRIVENRIASLSSTNNTQAIIGNIAVTLPEDGNNGVFGFLWVILAILPLTVGAGFIRPSLNSWMTQTVDTSEYGKVLGVSSAFVSLANATAPLVGGLIFQHYGETLPFLVGGILMGILLLLTRLMIAR